MSRSGNSLMSLLSAPVYRLYRLWCRSLRYTEINRAAIETTADLGRPVVLSLWHDELFPLIYLKRRLNIIALVSQSDDGDLLAGVLERMGLETARGSSSRGGVKALLAAARRMREAGLCGCVTVDGPRGPRHEVKEGAIFLACRADAPIVPIRLFMERRKLFRSWDRFQLPLPFSRVTMVCGDAYRVECDLHDPDAVARECRRLEDILNGLTPPETKPEPSPFQRFGTLLSDTTCRVSYGFARLIAKLGFSGIRSFGKGLGAAFWACLPSRRRLAAGNIASHLDLSPATAESLARASFTHNARSFLEAVLAPDFGLDHPLLDVERPDLLERLKRGERPAVITTGHFGAWELLASLLGDVSDRGADVQEQGAALRVHPPAFQPRGRGLRAPRSRVPGPARAPQKRLRRLSRGPQHQPERSGLSALPRGGGRGQQGPGGARRARQGAGLAHLSDARRGPLPSGHRRAVGHAPS